MGFLGLHRREVLRFYSESRRVVARLYHPDDHARYYPYHARYYPYHPEDHDCLVLTSPMT